MRYCYRGLLCVVLALMLSGCGQTVVESLKQSPAKKSLVGDSRTVVVLPFADYSFADDIESAQRRSMLINENVTDNLYSHNFRTPIQEDVFLYMVKRGIISLDGYENNKNSAIKSELQSGEWSSAMQSQIKKHLAMNKAADSGNREVSGAPGTKGLSSQEIVKIGRHFGADYVLRGRIISYKAGQEHTWNPFKKGLLPVVLGGESKILFGHAASDSYDQYGKQIAGASQGLFWGYRADWPYSDSGQTILGVSGGADANAIVWGAIGAGLGKMAHEGGRTNQAVVQLRITLQDAYSGDVVWTNRVDVRVSPESIFADTNYDSLFEAATEKAVNTLIDDMVASQNI